MQLIPDSEIEQRVLKELQLEQEVSSREVCVLSNRAVVTLRGSVPTVSAQLAAQRAAHRVSGVVAVINSTKVTLPAHARTATPVLGKRRMMAYPPTL